MSDLQITVQPLEDLLAASEATAEFKAAVRALAEGRRQELIRFNPGAPPVKVLRVLCKVLEQLPHEPLASAELRGTSGCSNFTGAVRLEPGALTVDFDWDCRWRAQQQGWVDAFGDPDQIRAARTLGYQCFADFRVARPAAATE